MNDDLHRFRSLCFFYACGKLDPNETAWMQHMLQSHPELQAELEADQRLVTAARDAYADALATTTPLLRFEDIAGSLETPHPSMTDTVRAWLANLWQYPVPSGWAFTAVATFVIATGVQTYQLREASQENMHNSNYRGLTGVTSANTPVLQVILSDTVTVNDLRRVLPDLNLTIVCGPDQQGSVNLAVLSGTSEQALIALKASKLAIDGHILKGNTQCGSR